MKENFNFSMCLSVLSKGVVVVQSLNHVWLFPTSWSASHQVPPSSTISWNLPKFMSIESMMLSNRLILGCPPPLPSPFVFSLSQHQGLFQWVSSSYLVARVLELQFQHPLMEFIHSNEYSGMISFTIDWFDLLAAKGLSKSLLQEHNSKASILWHLAFFMVHNGHIHTWPLEKP